MSQLEAIGGSEQAQTGSNYQANGYRLEVGPLALRAAEKLVHGQVGNSHGAAGAMTYVDEDAHAATSSEGAKPAERQEPREGNQPILANVYTDPKQRTVSLLLDEATANTVIYAVRLFAAESEAHAREVRMVGATLLPDSYGAANRQAIAQRHERVAARLRVLESNYRNVTMRTS